MFAYYLALAWIALRRRWGLTALMVLTIGFGVAAAMTTFAVFRAVSGDPIPWKSSKLFVPQIGLANSQNGRATDEPPDQLSYPDVMELTRDDRAVHQSALYSIGVSIVPKSTDQHPFYVSGHAVLAQFFPMLDVPFQYGSSWGSSDDQSRAPVVVISSHLNDALFGGVNSIGYNVQINGSDYRVVGVTDHWNPEPRYYDVVNSAGFTTLQDDVLIPLPSAIGAGINNAGRTDCPAGRPEGGFAGLQHSSCRWLSYMAELDTSAQVIDYKSYLDAFARARMSITASPNIRLRSLPEWLDYKHVVPADTKVSLLVAFGLFLVCLVNASGLLLAKLMGRASEVGVRRAIGAPRSAIYLQFVIESGMIGLVGGILGMVLTALGVLAMRQLLPPQIAPLAHFDLALFALTLTMALIATVLAGLYPSFRAASLQPAMHLKS
ncbi:MAG TPA: ABC transporter permease [Dyella sp.]|uniref:ABC transporter permease n=1 Tax=Dyella sp. TaxID=1869338 RepID=UPI002C23490A|nr:ABC transporter permease [Dyella sp.]HTV87185.1 ABC transporter permease [Dyella sp.]